jgi:hypothetical protein
MKVNLIGAIVGLLGVFLIYLGVSGRYQAFIGVSSSTSSTQTPTQQANATATSGAVTQGVEIGTLGTTIPPSVLQAIQQGSSIGLANGL